MNLTDTKQDERIRSALRNADRRGQLQVVAAVTGIAGGVEKLREIMNGTDELHIMDRGMLALHLGRQTIPRCVSSGAYQGEST